MSTIQPTAAWSDRAAPAAREANATLDAGFLKATQKAAQATARDADRRSWMQTWAFPIYSGLAEIV